MWVRDDGSWTAQSMSEQMDSSLENIFPDDPGVSERLAPDLTAQWKSSGAGGAAQSSGEFDMEDFAASPVTLRDHLSEQIAFQIADPAARLIARELADGLDDTGYLHADGLRSNVLHLPVRGNGDGGAYSTVDDISRFWRALFAGKIVSPATVADVVRRHTEEAYQEFGYGLGFWLRPDGRVQLEGYDAGVSFRSAHDPDTATTWTVISNWSDGAWPVARQVIR